MRWNTIAAGILAASVAMVVTPVSALACACCADPGMRFETFSKFGGPGFESEAIQQLTPTGKATLFRSAADWEEVVRGLNNPDKSEAYRVSLKRTPQTWTFEFADDKGNTGSIVMRLPREFELFGTDMRPGETQTIDRVTLYKELRITGTMTGAGMFALKGKGTRRATVIFQGQGSGCTFAADFHHWRLIATGPGVRYSFFGPLAQKQ